VDVPAVSLSTTSEQGAPTAKITDAWVSVNDRLLGVWELPARIPVLAEGRNTITVVPAVKRNGVFDDRLRYPFYTAWSGQADLVREGTSTIQPATTYTASSSFWIESFDDPDFARLNVFPNSDTTLERFTPATDPELLYIDGSPCGGFRLDAAHRYFGIYTDEDFLTNGGPVFLEMDYRCDVLLTIGVLYRFNNTDTFDRLVYLVPTTQLGANMPWNKVYIDLSPGVNAAGVSQRDFYIEASLPDGQGTGSVYLDNIKLVRFGS
jgi:hypothetical protein